MALKKHELANPASCLNKAASDEPVFVLRAKDPLAAQAVRLWAAMAEGRHEPEKLREARELAAHMDKWREAREPKAAAIGGPLPAEVLNAADAFERERSAMRQQRGLDVS